MKFQFVPHSFGNEPANKSPESIALRKMISQLVEFFQPSAVLQQSFIVNDIPTGFYVDTDKNILATIIGRLFDVVLSEAKNCCIKVSAKRYNDIILFRLSNTGKPVRSADHHNWRGLRLMAEKIGGCIIVDDIRQKPANITLSFRCTANAA